jgi:hypothetical protein
MHELLKNDVTREIIVIACIFAGMLLVFFTVYIYQGFQDARRRRLTRLYRRGNIAEDYAWIPQRQRDRIQNPDSGSSNLLPGTDTEHGEVVMTDDQARRYETLTVEIGDILPYLREFLGLPPDANVVDVWHNEGNNTLDVTYTSMTLPIHPDSEE